MEHHLNDVRKAIDEVDKGLLELLARRKELVGQVARTKSEHGLPVYLPEREASLIKARRAEAEAMGVSADLIEDVLRRVMRESYSAEGVTGFKPTRPDLGPIVVIGGGAGMGKLFVNMFELSRYEVRILEVNDWPRADKILADAGMVVVSVPIAHTVAVIDQLRGKLSASCLLTDLTSIKVAPLKHMLAVHEGPVLGLHPMFGSATRSVAKQLVVHCGGREPEAFGWLLDQIRIWGAELMEADASEHDHMMGTIQAMRHFATFVYGAHLREENVDLQRVLDFSSPIYRLELGMVGRLFAQAPNLYADIIFSSEEGTGIAERFLERFRREVEWLKQGDKQHFIERFEQIRDWFGDLSEQFLGESSYMLEKVYEKYSKRRS